jgi:hypothetical protein
MLGYGRCHSRCHIRHRSHESIFIFLNKTTNGGSENNLVYSNARENRKKRYNTSQKGL